MTATQHEAEIRRRRRYWWGIARSILFLAALALLAFFMARRREPTVLSVTPATALDDSFRPVETTEVFGPEDTFFVSVELRDYDPASPLSARWLYEGTLITETPLETGDAGSGFAGFVLRNEDPPWPAGRYTIEIIHAGEVLGRADFRVEP